MSRLLSYFLCLVNFVIFANAEGYYTIVAPGTIRPNSNFHVVCQVHKSEGPCSMKVSIDGPNFSSTKTAEVQPYSSATINFEIPSILEGEYNLTAEGLSGITFKNTTTLEFSKFDHIVLIQTDKATYKPGDLVRFRVLVLDKDTKPLKLQGPVNISINDPAQNRIKQVNDAQFTKGVYTGELQLSPFPNLGQWEISVQVGDNTETSRFDVDKYVLPKFEVSIDTPKDVAKKDERIKAIVRAKYTYGKPVKGAATLTIKPKYSYWRQTPQADITKTAPLDGKASFEFDIVNDLKFEKDWDSSYELSATVEETLTGFKQNATADVTVHSKRYQIQGVDVPSNYIENVPFEVTVVVKNYDGSPVQDIKNPVVITLTPEHYWGRPYPIPIPINIPVENDDDAKEKKDESKEKKDDKDVKEEEKEEKPMPIVIEKMLDDNGMATVQFTIPEGNKTFYNINAKYLDIDTNVASLSKQESKSGSYFELKSQTDKPTLDKEVSMKVSSNLPLKYFFYQVIGRGDIIDSGKIEVPDDRTYHVFKIKPTFDMIPTCNVLVFYIKDSEIVFDEKRLDFEQQFDNFVKINAPAQAKAGDEVDITISTKPNSYVGLLGVDQSVLLLKSGNDLSKDDVFNTLHRFDSRTPWGGWDYGAKVPGRDSGLITLTNAALPKVEVPPPGIYYSDVVRYKGATASVEITRARKEFPETWFWENLDTSSGIL